GLVVFACASIGCAFAQSLPQMLVFRALQGMSSGTGMVAGRAMIRDIYAGHQAQRVMSMVTMIFGLAPAVAPVIGGWLEVWLGWRAIFVFLTVFASLLWLGCYLQLAESLPREKRQAFNVRNLIVNYLK